MSVRLVSSRDNAQYKQLRQLAGSAQARELLEDFREVIGKFWLVKPKAASLDSLVAALKRAA